jgi:hypothetical protein
MNVLQTKEKSRNLKQLNISKIKKNAFLFRWGVPAIA